MRRRSRVPRTTTFPCSRCERKISLCTDARVAGSASMVHSLLAFTTPTSAGRMTRSCNKYPFLVTMATVPASLFGSSNSNMAWCKLGSNGSPVGSYCSTPFSLRTWSSCFSVILIPSWNDRSTWRKRFSSSVPDSTSSISSVGTLSTALSNVSITPTIPLANPWMPNFVAFSACLAVLSRRFSMSASTRSSLVSDSFALARKSSTSTFCFSNCSCNSFTSGAISSEFSGPSSPPSDSSDAFSFSSLLFFCSSDAAS
mmetsp:Transcript_9496/g.57927  ORF Transcript_9496/g.57927 Transcript_9496/m.57927 type:complete len:256 (-) Transcript_9496:248-1015(-)